MKLSKRQKTIVWWVSMPITFVIYLSYALIYWPFFLITDFLHRVEWVFSNLMMRFEMWTVDTPKGYFYNCPYKKTLRQEWKENGIDR